MKIRLMTVFLLALSALYLLPARIAIADTNSKQITNIDSVYAYAPDPGLYAQYGHIYLLDIGKLELNPDYTGTHSFHSITLVTGQEGINSQGTFIIEYTVGYDSVLVHTVLVTTARGDKIPVDPSQILYDIRPSDLMNNSLYTAQRQVRIVFPGLAIGCKIELNYSIVTYSRAMKGVSNRWCFSSTVPSKYSAYTVIYPQEMKLHFRTYNTSVVETVDNMAGKTVRHWERRNLSPLIQEPNGLPLWDTVEHVDFTTFSSWAEFGDCLLDSLWSQDLATPLESCELKLLNSVGLTQLSKRGKVSALFHAVQQQFRYLGLSIGEHNLKPYPSKTTCESVYGDCKDKANLLTKLLRHEGIECYPAALATWSRIFAFDTSMATTQYLNHVIVYLPDLDGKPVWLDPTIEYGATGWVGPVEANRWALVLDPQGSRLVRIEVTPRNADLVEVHGTVNIDSTGKGISQSAYRVLGINGKQWRSAYSAMNEDERRHLCDGFAGSANTRILSCQLDNFEMLDSILILRIEMEDDLAAEISDDLMIVSSQFEISSLLGLSDLREKRSTDFFLPHLGEVHIEGTRIVPAGYTIKSAPRDTTITSDWVDFVQDVERLSDNSLRVKRSIVTHHQLVPLAEYELFRKFLKDVDTSTRTKILFQKKT